MPSMKVRLYVLRDPASEEEKVGNIDYDSSSAGAKRDAATMRAIAEGGKVPIHFTSVRYNPVDGQVYCGLSAAENDLLWSFDPKTKMFADRGFNRISDSDDTKIHRSLEIASDGVIYGATSGWTGLKQSYDSRGGTVFSYNPTTDELKSYGIPCAHDYIQNTLYDEGRHLLYGCTHPRRNFFRLDLDSGAVKSWYIDSMPHRIAADDSGCVWGTYSEANHFFRYDPDADEMEFLDFGPPGVSADFDPANNWNSVDSIINGGDGYLYIGTVAGALCRLDPRASEVTYLGKPVASGRMSDLMVGPDGLLYLGAGALHMTSIATYDRRSGLFTNLGLVRDEQRDVTNFVVHQMTITDERVIYCGETDQAVRSAYLWECCLEP